MACEGCKNNLPFSRFRCDECNFVFHTHNEAMPLCEKCGGLVKEFVGIIPSN